jgi:hypothetical protein
VALRCLFGDTLTRSARFHPSRTQEGCGRSVLREIYEASGVRADFRHNVQRTDLPVDIESVVVTGDLPSNRSAAACRGFFDLSGPAWAVTLALGGARAGEAKPKPSVREGR